MEHNREPRNKPTHIWSINLWQRSQDYTMGNDSFFNKRCWGKWTAICKRMKLDHYLTPLMKINWKWVKHVNARPEAIKILEENIDCKLLEISLGNHLLGLTSKTKAIKTKINKWDWTKLKLFSTAKEIINKIEKQPTK